MSHFLNPSLLFLIGNFSYLVLMLAGLFAAAINAVAGGGSLISFPILIAFGVPPIPANATNAVALWPGSLASVWSYRKEARGAFKITAILTVPAVLGALFGAWTLLHTPELIFRRVVPILILLATLLLWRQPQLKRIAEQGDTSHRHSWAAIL